jgi:hypothetical protein
MQVVELVGFDLPGGVVQRGRERDPLEAINPYDAESDPRIDRRSSTVRARGDLDIAAAWKHAVIEKGLPS